MRICIFGASSNDIAPYYIEKTEALGKLLAERGHELIFGSGGHGLMGAAARGFYAGGGKITGIVPSFFVTDTVEFLYDKCDEVIYTDTMRERKSKMEELAEGYIITPGGVGTFEEAFEVMTLKQLARHTAPIVIFNINGYFDTFEKMISEAIEKDFVRPKFRDLYIVTDNCNEIIDYLENDKRIHHDIEELKNG